MTDGRGPDRDVPEAAIGGALRRAADEARAGEAFRASLRERFVSGALDPAAPAAPAPDPAPASGPARGLPIPRWIAYPAAAALLAGAAALSGALGPVAAPVEPVPFPASVRAAERVLAAVEGRAARVPVLAGVSWQRHIVDGRPWLLPPGEAFPDGKELRTLGSYMAMVEGHLAEALPEIASRPAEPVVTLVTPSREAFEALVAPHIRPESVDPFTIAFAVREPGALLLSPEALAPGGPPCEPLYVTHEAGHAWLHARCPEGTRIPLWLDEGLAGVAVARPASLKAACRANLERIREEHRDLFSPAEILSLEDFEGVERLAATKVADPGEASPVVSSFFSRSQALVLFLGGGDGEGGTERRAAFVKWMGEVLDGKVLDPGATARALGFADPAALRAACDAWLAE